MQKNRKVATFAQKQEIYEFLKKVIVPADGGYFQYVDKWTDVKVAEHFGSPHTQSSVANVRNQTFGKLREFRPPLKLSAMTSSKSTIDGRITDLEKRLAYLERELGVISPAPTPEHVIMQVLP